MKRSKHNLSYTKLFSCKIGELIPIGCVEILPGDSMQLSTSMLLRCTPLLAPVMHPVDVRIHHWFVPHRLVWDKWEDFITGGPDGNDASVFPSLTFGSAGVAGGLGDHYGVPPGAANSLKVSALPLRGYQLIWNEWYRDQDLQTPAVISTSSGNDTTTAKTKQLVAWEKDFFTSSRPWEQKGPTVTIPVTGSDVVFSETGTTAGTRTLQRASATANTGLNVTQAGTANAPIVGTVPNAVMSVSGLRQAMAIQRFEEARARYGSRYTEYLAYLGIRSSDARLQRPEYLGGGRQRIQFSEVLTTSVDQAPSDKVAVGELFGHGISAMRSNRFRRFFEEHGYVHTLMSVRPKTIYSQACQRSFFKFAKTDFWQRELEHIGQAPVKLKEVRANGTAAALDNTFGWQDRYDEYRRKESYIAGDFRNLFSHWHMARFFGTDPALNSSFITCVPDKSCFADQVNDNLLCHAYHSLQMRRMVSKTGSSFIF